MKIIKLPSITKYLIECGILEAKKEIISNSMFSFFNSNLILFSKNFIFKNE